MIWVIYIIAWLMIGFIIEIIDLKISYGKVKVEDLFLDSFFFGILLGPFMLAMLVMKMVDKLGCKITDKIIKRYGDKEIW